MNQAEPNNHKQVLRAGSVVLVILTIMTFGQTVGFDLTNFDDPRYLDHPLVKRGLTWDGVVWAFSDHSQNMSQTLPWISFMIEYDLFGRSPSAFHGINLVLHGLNTCLLFVFLARVTGRPALGFLTAALFCLHPLHVESVAWVSGRKDLLGVLFTLLMLMAYERFAASGRRAWFSLSMVAFLLALLAKPVYVTLPFLLLVLDFWPLRRFALPAGSYGQVPFSRLVIEKLPLFILTLFFCWVAYSGQAGRGILIGEEVSPFSARLANAPVLYVLYLFKTFWPFNLSPFYPLHLEARPLWEVAAAVVLILGITAAFWQHWRQRPYLLAGWLWFLGTLVPVIGLIRAGWFEMADRYTYFPLIGLLLVLVWGGADLLRGFSVNARLGMCALLLVCLGMLSYSQTRIWRNGVTLFSHTVRLYPESSLVQVNLGNAYMLAGQPAQAVEPLKAAIRLDPENFRAYHNLADAYRFQKMPQEAIAQYRALLKMNPNYLASHYYLGKLYYDVGNIRRAIQHTLVAEALILQQYGNRIPEAAKVRQRLDRYYKEYRLKPDEIPDLRNPSALLQPENESPDA